MNETRRDFVKLAGMLGVLAAAGLLTEEQAIAQQQAWNKAAFDAKTLADAMRALGASAPVESRDIVITAPEIAENGASVQIGVASRIGKTDAMHLLIEKNPSILAASFAVPAGTEPNFITRVKMGETSNVYALVRADGRFYVAKKEVKVTAGGCG